MTQTAFMSTISFPNELVEAFIIAAWSLPLAVDERLSLMITLPLVNSSWRDAYMRVSSKDVYIPCGAFYHYLFRTIFPDERTKERLETRCCSITFTVDHPAMPVQSGGTHRSALDAIEDLFYAIEYPRFPNLRRISILYHNVNFDDIFKHARLAEFPSQVTTLEITHSFSPNVPPFLVSALRDKHYAELGLPWRMPNIRRLTLGGVGSDYVADMVVLCPNLRVLELSLAPHTDIFISLMDSVEWLILHAPEGADLSAHRLLSSGTLAIQPTRVDSRWWYLQASTCYSLQWDDMSIITLTYPSRMPNFCNYNVHR